MAVRFDRRRRRAGYGSPLTADGSRIGSSTFFRYGISRPCAGRTHASHEVENSRSHGEQDAEEERRSGGEGIAREKSFLGVLNSAPLFFFFFWNFFVLQSRIAEIDRMGARSNERHPGEMRESGQHQQAHDAFENIDPCAVLRKHMNRHADQRDQEERPSNYYRWTRLPDIEGPSARRHGGLYRKAMNLHANNDRPKKNGESVRGKRIARSSEVW
jgi:hypothetical protein